MSCRGVREPCFHSFIKRLLFRMKLFIFAASQWSPLLMLNCCRLTSIWRRIIKTSWSIMRLARPCTRQCYVWAQFHWIISGLLHTCIRRSEGKKSEKSNWMGIETISGTLWHCEMGLEASDVTEVGRLHGIWLFCEHKRCSLAAAIAETLHPSSGELFTYSRASIGPSALALHYHATFITIRSPILTYFNP